MVLFLRKQSLSAKVTLGKGKRGGGEVRNIHYIIEAKCHMIIIMLTSHLIEESLIITLFFYAGGRATAV